MGSPRHDDYQPLTQATVCLMSPLKGVLDNADELPQGKLFWFVKQRRSLSSACLFFLLVLLFFHEYLYIIVIYLSRLSVQLHRAIFRWIPSQTGGRWGMGGVVLDSVTARDDMPGRASFCCCLQGSVTFSGSSPQGQKESGLAWFHKPPGAMPRGSVWTDEEKRKGHLRHRVSCRWQDGYMLTFLCTVVRYTLMDQTWKPWQPDVTCHPRVLKATIF